MNCYEAENKRAFSQRIRRLCKKTSDTIEEWPMKPNITDFYAL